MSLSNAPSSEIRDLASNAPRRERAGWRFQHVQGGNWAGVQYDLERLALDTIVVRNLSITPGVKFEGNHSIEAGAGMDDGRIDGPKTGSRLQYP